MDYFRGSAQGDCFPRSSPEDQGLDSSRLLEMAEYMEASGEDFHSVLILRNGHLVFEVYDFPYEYRTRHMLASATKAFTSALVGIAIDKGYIPGTEIQGSGLLSRIPLRQYGRPQEGDSDWPPALNDLWIGLDETIRWSSPRWRSDGK